LVVKCEGFVVVAETVGRFLVVEVKGEGLGVVAKTVECFLVVESKVGDCSLGISKYSILVAKVSMKDNC
jgi:hypothetical protein